jgi:hypothetical protein
LGYQLDIAPNAVCKLLDKMDWKLFVNGYRTHDGSPPWKSGRPGFSEKFCRWAGSSTGYSCIKVGG